MKRKRAALLVLVFSGLLLQGIAAQERSLTLKGMMGGAGIEGEAAPFGGAELGYHRSEALAQGDLVSGTVGIGYAGLGYRLPTAIGLTMLQVTAAPVPTEYVVLEEGKREKLPMDAPLYGGTIAYMLPAEPLTVTAQAAVEARPWRSDELGTTAPADWAAINSGIAIEYRLGHRSWTANPLAEPAGWAVTGGYRNVYRPGYRSWGDTEGLNSHNDRPQHQTKLGLSVVLPLGGKTSWAALRFAMEQNLAFNSYVRDRPRYGEPAGGTAVGVSGYTPGSLPSDNANAATVSLAAPLGENALVTLRFDWLHRHDDGEEDERRGVGVSAQTMTGNIGRCNLSLGVALDPHPGVDLPVAGSVTWTKSIPLRDGN